MPRFNEKTVIEDHIVQELQKNGWTFVTAENLDRESFEEPLLTKNLIKQIKKINNTEFSDEDIKNIIRELKFKPTTQEGCKQILRFLKEGIPIRLEKQRTLLKVKLFDYTNIKNNEFIVTRQPYYAQGNTKKRPDIVLYINGIPLVDIECKNPASFAEDWTDAYKQIKKYEKILPEVYKYIQIGVAAEQIVKYFPIISWQDEVRTNKWKEADKDELDSIIEMLSAPRLLDIIQNFVIFRFEFGVATKVITRYMQYRAVNKIVNRVIKNIEGKESKNKGLIWHWQGSGKTLEMIFAANKLYHAKQLENPTIFFIVDRRELEVQIRDEINALDIVSPEIIDSVHKLKKIIEHDEYKGKRGLFVTLVHKFRAEELQKLELELVSLNKETILSRKNVIAFIDEGHRTQYGTLAAQMRSILKNSFFFAFTGTPISKPKLGKDTYAAFSYPPDEKYLDQYFITDSIKDGFTVKIAYKPRLEREVHLKKEQLNTFLEIEDEELPEKIRDNVKEAVKKNITLTKAYLENPDRIAKIAKDIAQHFKENVNDKFKAMVVAANRKACVQYKKELDKYLPNNYSRVIFSYSEQDEPTATKWYIEEETKQHGKDYDSIRKDMIEKFKEEEYPKILIVTDMLLTGFDAPVLQTMYLDKPLKEHRLLQAIARTNRPYKDIKEAGLIIDYIGILNEFKKAFELYSKDEINGSVYSIEELRDQFKKQLDDLLNVFKSVSRENNDRKTLLEVIDIISSKNIGKEFINQYKALRRVFELLGPDIIKAKLSEDYQWITAVYIYYLRTVLRENDVSPYVQKYFDKTIKLIHKSTNIEELKDLPVIEFDEKYIQNLQKKIKNKKEKAANIVFALNRYILVERMSNLIYESVVEKVERLLNSWKQKTRDFDNIYNDGLKVITQINNLEAREKELGLSKKEYSLLVILEKNLDIGEKSQGTLINDVKTLSKQLDDLTFSGWVSQTTALKSVERTIRIFIRKYMKEYNLDLDQLEMLYNRLLSCVREFN